MSEMLTNITPEAPKASPVKKSVPKSSASRVKPAASVTRPEELANELGITGKELRGWLRGTYPRKPDVKGSNWTLTPDMVKAGRAKFASRKAKK